MGLLLTAHHQFVRNDIDVVAFAVRFFDEIVLRIRRRACWPRTRFFFAALAIRKD